MTHEHERGRHQWSLPACFDILSLGGGSSVPWPWSVPLCSSLWLIPQKGGQVAALRVLPGFAAPVEEIFASCCHICPRSRYVFEQRLGVLQVSRVQSLGEPVVDRRQQLEGLGPLALLLPQPAQAHGRPQLPGFGLLAAGNSQGLLEAGFRLRLVRDGLPPPQL